MTSATQFHYWFLCGLVNAYFMHLFFPPSFSHLSNWPSRKYLHFKMKFTQRHKGCSTAFATFAAGLKMLHQKPTQQDEE